MSRYGVDKPDTRFGLELVDVTAIVHGSGFKLFAAAPGQGYEGARRREPEP